MPSRVLLGLAIAIAVVAMTPGRVAACSCGGTTPTAALERADVAFTGVVVDSVGTNPLYPLAYFGGDEIHYVVTVEERIKGDPPDLILVSSLRSGAECGLGMAVGQHWLLYGHQHDLSGASRRGQTWVFLCDANRLISTDPSPPGVARFSGPLYPVPGIHIVLLAALTVGIVVVSLTVFLAADRLLTRGRRRRRAGTGSGQSPG